MKREVTILFAATVGAAGSARADIAPLAPAVQPRTLASGAPACGNIVWKTPDPPGCAAVRVIADVARELDEIAKPLADLSRALTVGEVRRPGS